jgi:tetratricopeptide (TPR) repeat protein
VIYLLAAVVFNHLSASPVHSRVIDEWPRLSRELKSLGETYKKWGITFTVKDSSELLAENAPIPGRLEVTGSFDSAQNLQITVATKVGEKHELAFEGGGTFKINEEGVATQANLAAFVAGHGVSGRLQGSRETGYQAEAGFEESLYRVGVRFGQAQGGPLTFGLNFGPVSVEIDPTVYAERLVKMAPQMMEKAGEKLGGVTLSVDADAMAYAIADAPAPPPAYLLTRKVVSLKALAGQSDATLGDLNELEGVLVDRKNKDVLLVGSNDPDSPPIPVERIATVERCVYENGLHPGISIDPDSQDLSAPHRGRIEQTPDDLRSSSLIQTMFTADYAMKQLTLGLKKVDGVTDLVELEERAKAGIVPTRFWIHPAALHPGDVRVSKTANRTLYTVETEPVILTEPNIEISDQTQYSEEAVARSRGLGEEEALNLSLNYRNVEKAWPESGFAEARHDLQLTNLFSLLREHEREPWEAELLRQFGQIEIASVDVPDRFTALSSREYEMDGQTFVLRGGMTTEVEVPDPGSAEVGSSLEGVSDDEDVTELPADRPVATLPAVTSDLNEAKRAMDATLDAVRVGNWSRAESASRRAVRLAPHVAKAHVYHLTSLSYLRPVSLGEPEFHTELSQALKEFPGDWSLWWIEARREAFLGGRATTVAEKRSCLQEGIAALDKGIRLNPTEATLYAERANREFRLGLEGKAVADWQAALKLDPHNGSVYLRRAGYYAAHGKQAEGFSDLLNAIRYSDEIQMPLLYLAIWNERLGDSASAKECVESAIRMESPDWRIYEALGKVSLAMGDIRALVLLIYAEDHFMKKWAPNASPLAPPTYPKKFRKVDLWADFTKRLGDPPDESEAPSSLVEFDPEMPYMLGKACMLCSDYMGAIRYFKPALVYSPERKAEIQKALKECQAKVKSFK